MTSKKRGRPESGKAREVEKFFKDNPGKDINVLALMAATKLNGEEVRKAISYLRSRAPGGGAISIDTLLRGQLWRYTPRETASPSSASVTPMPNVVQGKEVPTHTPAPSTEPEATFRILGTVMETGELLLSGQTSGVTGVWLAREI